MENKHIAFIIPEFVFGGLEKVLILIMQGFLDNGCKVDLVLAHAKGELISEIPSGVNVVILNPPRKWRLISSIPQLFRYFTRNNDLQVVFPFWYGLEIIIILIVILTFLTRKNRPMIIYSIHTIAGCYAHFFKSYRRLIAEVSTWISLRCADKVIAVSKGAAQSFSKHYHFPLERIKAIYNPIPFNDVIEKSKQSIDISLFNSDIPVILSAGRMQDEKNFPNLIKAFSIVRKNIQAKLVILGEGKERRKLELLIKELGLECDVDLPGFVINPYPYIKNASVFVLSSDYEGFSLVLLEALALGTPVVSTDCPFGPLEILENGKYGKLVPVNDPEALASAILDTLKNPLPKQFLQERAKDFSLEIAVQKYIDLIEYAKKSE